MGWAGSGDSVVWGPSWDHNHAGPGCQGTQEKPSRCCWPVPGRCGASFWAGMCSRGSLTKAQEMCVGEHSRVTRLSVACRDRDGANDSGWWEQISCLVRSWNPPAPSCSPGREQGLTLLSNIPKKGKQEIRKLKTAGFGGEEPPARADDFQRQQKTCPGSVSLSLAQAVPEERGGLTVLWPLVLHPGVVEMHLVLVSTWGVKIFSVPGSPRHVRDGWGRCWAPGDELPHREQWWCQNKLEIIHAQRGRKCGTSFLGGKRGIWVQVCGCCPACPAPGCVGHLLCQK